LPHGTHSIGGDLKIKQNKRIWTILSVSQCRIPQEVLSMKLKGRLRSRWHNRSEKNIALKEGWMWETIEEEVLWEDGGR
jgi:hypothetical protein